MAPLASAIEPRSVDRYSNQEKHHRSHLRGGILCHFVCGMGIERDPMYWLN